MAAISTPVATDVICRTTIASPGYPALLREIVHPPHELFVRGAPIRTDIPLVSIVGTRRISSYGRLALQQLVPPLVRAGVGIVSGLAFGVDAVAHALTVEARGYTIAALPGSVDDASIFPTSNRALARRILESGGTLVSENPTGALIQSFSFPLRNRIIAGLTQLTIVVEAPRKSGALITANLALDANRSVGAVPGPITSRVSDGCNSLLHRGAYVITSASDVLEILNLKVPDTATGIPAEIPEECHVLAPHLTASPITTDELIERTQLPPGDVLRMITTLELLGCVRSPVPDTFVRVYL
ncbi:MAG: DNA-processing protein DprA [Patescibacteria group bacterium]